MQNDFNDLAQQYRETDSKPDKQFSILPTVLKLIGDTTGKTVVDLGCGSGFFTRYLASSEAIVIGLDNAEEQIELAKQKGPSNIDYRVADIFRDQLPQSDIVHAPFVLNYASSVGLLEKLLSDIFQSLRHNGSLVATVDLPTGQDLRRFGATKTLQENVDESPITITLYNEGAPVCTLYAVYFTKSTITSTLEKVGFREISWHSPIISQGGIEAMGDDFWRGYTENPELGYVTAQKI